MLRLTLHLCQEGFMFGDLILEELAELLAVSLFEQCTLKKHTHWLQTRKQHYFSFRCTHFVVV